MAVTISPPGPANPVIHTPSGSQQYVPGTGWVYITLPVAPGPVASPVGAGIFTPPWSYDPTVGRPVANPVGASIFSTKQREGLI